MNCISVSSDFGAFCTFESYHLSVSFEDTSSYTPSVRVEKTLFLDCATVVHIGNMVRLCFQIFLIPLLSIQGIQCLKYIIMHSRSDMEHLESGYSQQNPG